MKVIKLFFVVLVVALLVSVGLNMWTDSETTTDTVASSTEDATLLTTTTTSTSTSCASCIKTTATKDIAQTLTQADLEKAANDYFIQPDSEISYTVTVDSFNDKGFGDGKMIVPESEGVHWYAYLKDGKWEFIKQSMESIDCNVQLGSVGFPQDIIDKCILLNPVE